MKRIILIIVVVAVVVVGAQFIPQKQDIPKPSNSAPNAGEQGGMRGPGGPGMGGPRRDPLEGLKGEDGRIEIAKLDASDMPDRMKERVRESLTEADADGDGFLDEEEQKVYEEKRRERFAQMRGRGMGGPGGPGMGGERPAPFSELKDENGNVDLAKLDESQAPDFVKDALRKADANADNLIDPDEMKAFEETMRANMPGPGVPGMGGMGARGMNGAFPLDAPAPNDAAVSEDAPDANDGAASEEASVANEAEVAAPTDAPAATEAAATEAEPAAPSAE